MKITISVSAASDLTRKLLANGVSADVVCSLEQAVSASITGTNRAAKAYASAMEQAFVEYGVEGVRMQVLYLLSTLASWKGDDARACKKVLKKWVSQSR